VSDTIENHIASTSAHVAENISFNGEVPGNNVDEAKENVNTRISDIVAQAGNDNTEIVDARGGFSVLSARLDNDESQFASHLTDTRAHNFKTGDQTWYQNGVGTFFANVKLNNTFEGLDTPVLIQMYEGNNGKHGGIPNIDGSQKALMAVNAPKI
jgi:hypothetical protein